MTKQVDFSTLKNGEEFRLSDNDNSRPMIKHDIFGYPVGAINPISTVITQEKVWIKNKATFGDVPWGKQFKQADRDFIKLSEGCLGKVFYECEYFKDEINAVCLLDGSTHGFEDNIKVEYTD